MSGTAIKVDISVYPRFRAEVYPIGAGSPMASVVRSDWLETYEAAESELVTMLVDKGRDFVGEVDKMYATSNTWAELDRKKAEAAAK